MLFASEMTTGAEVSINERSAMSMEKLFDTIKLALWGNGTPVVDGETFAEMKKQAIASLLAPYLSSLKISKELRQEWKMFVFVQTMFGTQCNYMQSVLPMTVPYVILKGTSVAKYYPYPDYRMMGDIDIMTRREDLETACQQLMADGYVVENSLNREISLVKNEIVVELHRRFATLNDPVYAKRLDDLIIENINPSHVLPDLINGLVVLEHISQHMEGGLGLRQIIDWMMFVDKCLPDDKWPEFQKLADEIGLEQLAIVATRMCELYLGLPHREWCAGADNGICEQLMDYVMQCGNFGNKKTSDSDISKNAFMTATTPKAAFKLLQKQGLTNWTAAKKHKILRPFAWIYQAFRYAVKGFMRENAVSKIKKEYEEAMQRKAMFDALGVATVAKGPIAYKDGKYVKE